MLWEMKLKSIGYYLGLACLLSLVPLTTRMYTPCFQNISNDFAVPMVIVQHTLIIFLAISAVIQLWFGRLSFKFGIRQVTLYSLFFYSVSSILAVSAHNIYLFYGARIVQAITAALGVVSYRAIIGANQQNERRKIERFSLISILMSLIILPDYYLAGVITHFYNWHAVFYLMVITGVVALILNSIYLTQMYTLETSKLILPTFQNFILSKNTLEYLLPLTLQYLGFILFITVAPDVMYNQKHWSVLAYATTMLYVGCGFFIGSVITYFITKFFNITSSKLITYGLSLSLIVSCVVFYLAKINQLTFYHFTVAIMFYQIATSFINKATNVKLLSNKNYSINACLSGYLGFSKNLIVAILASCIISRVSFNLNQLGVCLFLIALISYIVHFGARPFTSSYGSVNSLANEKNNGIISQ
ncbi:MAG: MFS transporter [Legionellales bacterium]|nr:MFS transporter [Legionellales bacterium]